MRPTRRELGTLVDHFTRAPWTPPKSRRSGIPTLARSLERLVRDFPIWNTVIRNEMEESGTWPTMQRSADPRIVAEFLSRAQRRFWIEVIPFCNAEQQLDPARRRYAVPMMNTLRAIYLRLRTLNRSFRNEFYLWGWCAETVPIHTTIHVANTQTLIHVTPFVVGMTFQPVLFKSVQLKQDQPLL